MIPGKNIAVRYTMVTLFYANKIGLCSNLTSMFRAL